MTAMNYVEMTELEKNLRQVADFPKPGICFLDMSPILADGALFASVIHHLCEPYRGQKIDKIVAIESRGFILGAAIAGRFAKGFIPLRKAGKLPPPVVSQSYALEYGNATLEMRHGTGKVVVIDDVLATGGTLDAGLQLCQRAGYEPIGAAVLIDLRFLNEYRFKGARIPSVIQYE